LGGGPYNAGPSTFSLPSERSKTAWGHVPGLSNPILSPSDAGPGDRGQSFNGPPITANTGYQLNPSQQNQVGQHIQGLQKMQQQPFSMYDTGLNQPFQQQFGPGMAQQRAQQQQAESFKQALMNNPQLLMQILPLLLGGGSQIRE